MKERFNLFWKKRLTSEDGMKTLRAYKLVKQTFGIETYLDNVPDKNTRKGLCCFRISAHRLRIERGRYWREKPEERLCDSCNVVDNEIHFLCQCKKKKKKKKKKEYDTLRLKMKADLENCNVGLDKCVTDIEMCVNLMTNNDASINKVVAYFV